MGRSLPAGNVTGMAEDRQDPEPAAHGGALAVAAARAHGVSTMFTLSGGHVFLLYDGAVTADPPMRLLDVRHEQTAVFAAEATARLTRTPGLAVLTAGPDNVNQVRELTCGHGVERAIDCSASAEARATAIRATRKWGKMVMVGEGGTVTFNPSPDIIHDQKTIYGSWVTSTWLMEELVERLVRWNLHPEEIVTHRFPLEKADEAYQLMASGRCGKVAVCPVGE